MSAAGSWRRPHDDPPGLDDLVRVGGPEDEQARHRPKRGELLDGLVGRAVLADADRVVGEDVQDRDLHQRGQPDRGARVVGEDQEARPVRRGASSAPCRWRSRPTRARGRRSGGCVRARLVGLEVAGAVERRDASSSTATGRQSRRAATGTAWATAFSTRARTSHGWRCPSGPAGRSGSAASQPSGSSRRWMRSSSSAARG